MSTNTVKRLPPHVVSALANGLQVERENRITDFDELRSQLSVAHTAKAIQEEISRTASMNLAKEKGKKKRNGMSGVSVAVISAAITVLVLGVAGVFGLCKIRLRVCSAQMKAQSNLLRARSGQVLQFLTMSERIIMMLLRAFRRIQT